ncbi:hypothetical protein Calag_1160 [Caldisphaera lagunensis DSM 15908]|uniref:DUF2067 domain-containing protein n=1 Tax=Caldisphaera lagunensis (strain DSM 15908 / JCM 11604 / ANMR 0165 / IC-154) TaxID=1056495 RepID=L0AAH3_CALLD|nr:DUF2067 domain-containing protein [Caldisphaera lagunensis]AFZ70881.1 hypothetical protein Calag_1160 [Caldisphaera lagunensis DSM 15908]
MKSLKKRFIFNLKEGYDIENIFKKINTVISSQEATIKVENNKLIIDFYVTPRDINYIKSKIKEILSFETNKNKVKGFKYSLKDLNPEGGKDFFDMLEFCLSKLGYKTTIQEEFLITTARKEKVYSLANIINENLKHISGKNYGNALIKALACYLTLRERDFEKINNVIEKGLSLGILEENKNKIYTRYSWKDTYEMLGKVQ